MNFQNQDVAQRWDADADKRNPMRTIHIDLLLAILQDTYQPGDVILDLGYGSGLIEAMIFERIPQAQLIGVDASLAMMALAQERLQRYAAQFRSIQHDLAELGTLSVDPCRFIISSQALHHLTDAQMQAAYAHIANLLQPGGLFLLLDRIALDTPELFDVYQSLWRWQDRHYGSATTTSEGEDYATHNRNAHERGDLPLSLPRHLELMRTVGLEAACLHISGVRAVFVARKPAD